MTDASRPEEGREDARPVEQGPLSGEGPAGSAGDPPPGTGTSPFDEPTAEFPQASPPSSGMGEPDPETQVLPRAHVLSREDDVLGGPGGDQQTTRIPSYEELSAPRREPADIAAAMDTALDDKPVQAKRGTLDVGLLVVRVVLGAVLLAHGLQKLTGRWGGPDLDGFRDLLDSAGFDYAHALSIIGPVGEVVVGAALIIGLFTPIAAAGAVAILINAWCFTQAGTAGLQFFTDQSGARGSGVELETMLLAAAVGVSLTGPGLISFDLKRGWTRRPRYGSIGFLVLGVAAGIVVWIVFNGANPFGDVIADRLGGA